MSDRQTIGVYDKRAAQYAKLVSRDTADQDLQAFLDAVPKGGRVLDLGCGPGNSAAIMRDSGLEVEAWDASAEMVALAQRTYGIDAQRKTFDDLKAVGDYDAIWANFSLLHAPRADLPRYLGAIHAALKPNGVFHIGMKLGSRDGRDGLGRMYTYVSDTELLALLEEAGFRIVTSRQDKDKGLSGSIDPFIIVISHA